MPTAISRLLHFVPAPRSSLDECSRSDELNRAPEQLGRGTSEHRSGAEPSGQRTGHDHAWRPLPSRNLDIDLAEYRCDLCGLDWSY